MSGALREYQVQTQNYKSFWSVVHRAAALTIFGLSPLMTEQDPAFIIVFAFKLQLACRYRIGSSLQNCSGEQQEATSSEEMFYTNTSIMK